MAGTVESEMEQRISDRVLAIELEPSAQTTESGPAFAGQYQGSKLLSDEGRAYYQLICTWN